MLTEVKTAKKNLADQLIKKMEQRQFEVSYCETKEEAFDKACSYLTDGCTVSCGGSATLKEIGMMSYLEGEGSKKYNYIDRSKVKTEQDKREVFAKAVQADYYFMSSNAITMNGELVNIDGNGNRVAALCYGPEYVVCVIGLNKVAKDVEEGIWRVRNIAAPPNTVRLNCDTPCAKTGSCANCLTPACICAEIVVTRFSRVPGRIKVILVGEDLGY